MPQLSRAAPPAEKAATFPACIWSLPRGFLLLSFIVIAAVFRLLHLGARSLWLDEPATIAFARMPWPRFAHIWQYGEAAYQGEYFLLMRGWMQLGGSEWWARLPSAIFAIASVPLIYAVARKLMGERAALASALLLAVNPTAVYYSQDARSYTMAIFLVLASAWFFVCAVEQNRERDWLLWTLCSALAVYTHLFAALVMVGQAASLLTYRKSGRWSRMLPHALLILVISLPVLTLVLRIPPHDLQFPWMPSATPKQLLHLALFLGGSGDKLLFFGILWVAALRSIWRDRLRHDEPENWWRGCVLILWAVIPVVILALVSLRNPVFVQRYMIFCLPATIMLAARGLIALPQRNLGLWLVLILSVSCVANIFLGYRKPREDWRGATRAVVASAAPGDAVVIYPSYARPGFDYYYDPQGRSAAPLRLFGQFYNQGEDEEDVVGALNANEHAFQHVWVVMRDQGPGLRALEDYSPTVAAKLTSVFGAPKASIYPGITVLQFGR